MVTLKNIEQHTIPFDQFKLKWRFNHGLNRDYFKCIEGFRISEAAESEQLAKKWLYQSGLPFDQQVYVSWDSNTAAITSWKMIVKYWTDFDYGDDLVVVDKSLSWIRVFFHYDYIQFGTNLERSARFCENELAGTAVY